MGRRGPIPNPSSGESKRGRNTLKRKGAPQKQTSVESPKFLKAKPLALEFWDRHAPDLIAVKRLQPLQAELFGTICEMAAEVRELTNDVSSEGYVVEGQTRTRAQPESTSAARCTSGFARCSSWVWSGCSKRCTIAGRDS
jgi:phage terminase small subunit